MSATATAPAPAPFGPLQVGPFRLPSRAAFAPMSGVSNLPARLVAHEAGAGLVFSETVNAGALARGEARAVAKLASHGDEGVAAFQLFGADPAAIGEASRRAIDLGARWIDLNLGCPVKKFQRQGAGAAMMRDPARVRRAVAAIRRAGPDCFSVKMRAGWTADTINAPEIARIAADEGARLVTVHGRTRAQQYRGRVNAAWIHRVVAAIPELPVFANGDVRSRADALRLLDESGAAGVMVGRAAVGRPWLFAEICGRPRAGMSPADRRGVFERHLAAIERHLEGADDEARCLHARRYAAAYTKGLPGGARFREGLGALAGVDRIAHATLDFLSNDASADARSAA